MKQLFSKLFDVALWGAALAIVVLALWPKRSGPSVGGQAAAFSVPLVGQDGQFSYEGHSERPILIEAFASWCGACQRSARLLDAVGEDQREGKLEVVAISIDDDAEAANQARRSWPILFPVAHDATGSFQRAYDVRVLPTYILLAPDGRILHVTVGPPGATDVRRWLHPED